jgi:hypothetical protein
LFLRRHCPGPRQRHYPPPGWPGRQCGLQPIPLRVPVHAVAARGRWGGALRYDAPRAGYAPALDKRLRRTVPDFGQRLVRARRRIHASRPSCPICSAVPPPAAGARKDAVDPCSEKDNASAVGSDGAHSTRAPWGRLDNRGAPRIIERDRDGPAAALVQGLLITAGEDTAADVDVVERGGRRRSKGRSHGAQRTNLWVSLRRPWRCCVYF